MKNMKSGLLKFIPVVIVIALLGWGISSRATDDIKSATANFSVLGTVSEISEDGISISDAKGSDKSGKTTYELNISHLEAMEMNTYVPLNFTDIKVGDRIIAQGLTNGDTFFIKRIISFTSTPTPVIPDEIATSTATTTDEFASSTATTTDDTASSTATTTEEVAASSTPSSGSEVPAATTTEEVATTSSTSTEEVATSTPSIAETITDAIEQVIDTVTDTIQDVVDAVTGGGDTPAADPVPEPAPVVIPTVENVPTE